MFPSAIWFFVIKIDDTKVIQADCHFNGFGFCIGSMVIYICKIISCGRSIWYIKRFSVTLLMCRFCVSNTK